ncbi:hypothetical protein NUACC21_60540 [Scytonema sp. NUACC21]
MANWEKDLLADLNEQLEAVQRQMRTEGDYERLVLLQRRANDLLQEIEKNDKFRDINKYIEDKIQYIDFKKAIKLLEVKLKKFDNTWGEAILVMNHTSTMAGQYFVSRIRNLLDKQTGTFRYFPIGITVVSEKNKFGILTPLSQQLKVNCDSNLRPEEYTQSVINKICTSLQTGSVIFIEIQNWDFLSKHQDIMPWLLNDFWRILVAEGRKKVQDNKLRQVKFITIISAASKMDLKKYKTLFKEHNVLEISLSKWSKQDIISWLEEYSTGLINPGLNGEQIDDMAEEIYSRAKGVPSIVRSELENELNLLLKSTSINL